MNNILRRRNGIALIPPWPRDPDDTNPHPPKVYASRVGMHLPHSGYDYCIPWCDIEDAADVARWAHHLLGKTWPDNQREIRYFIGLCFRCLELDLYIGTRQDQRRDKKTKVKSGPARKA